MKKLLVVGIILLLVGVSIPSTGRVMEQSSTVSSDGTTLYVGGSGPENYTKIQDAIDDASDGDTVFVYNGTYVENVVVNKSINLFGEDRNTTVIDGNRSGDVIDIVTDNVTICGFIIQNSEKYYFNAGIKIKSDNCYISYNTITNNDFGIHGYYCDNTKIHNNQIINNYHGIFIFTSNNNNEISHSGIKDNIVGIGICNSNNSTIEYNFIFNNTDDGIYFWNSSNNIIQYNRIWSSGKNGIYLDGIDGSADNNKILRNDISSNNYNGIFLRYADENIISQNTIKSNIQKGIWLSAQNENYCYDNLIYHNDFIENSPNAADEGYNNTWDNGYPSGGNYWDDYTGEDNDGDGIGDSPYPIPGGENEDRYPLMEPFGGNQPPSVEIINPKEGYFHLSGIPLLPTPFNLILDTISFGGFRLRPIQVHASVELMVSLYINDIDKGYGNWNPETGSYEWQWAGMAFGEYHLKVKARDIYGRESWESMDVWNFCFLP